MNGLPEKLDLSDLGIDASAARQAELIHEGHGSRLYRLTAEGRSVVVKWFADADDAIEVRAYELLARLGVPTLPVHGRSDSALALEDLATSCVWRLATGDDCESADVGRAVGEWYRKLHQAGYEMMADGGAPDWLGYECEALNPESILAIGDKLGLADLGVWRLCADHIEPIKQATRSEPATLNYTDFHWTNLALTREPPLQAVVFDYHMLGIGMAYSDLRNALGSLPGPPGEAFRQAYGPLADPERQTILDEPVATLYALHEALKRPRLPRWAKGLIEIATDGRLETHFRKALELIG